MDFKKFITEMGLLRFDGESPEGNIVKAEKLSKVKVGVQVKFWDLEMEGEKIDQKLLMTEEVQEGSNEKKRTAIMELMKINNPEMAKVFDDIEKNKRALAIIGEVERFNERVLKIKEIMG